MTSDLSAIRMVATILETVGAWPIGSLFLVLILGPWIMQFFFSRSQEKRFAAVQQMYENNVELVMDYEKLVKEKQDMARDQQDIIIMHTQATTKLITIIEERIK